MVINMQDGTEKPCRLGLEQASTILERRDNLYNSSEQRSTITPGKLLTFVFVTGLIWTTAEINPFDH